MPIWKYPKIKIDETKIAKAVIRDAPISFKESYEVCKILKGMMLNDAKNFLRQVIELKEAIPYVRYKLSIAHKKGLAKKWRRWSSPIGRYPVKVARYMLKLLDNVENNAIVKGLNNEKLKIVHIAAHRGYYLKRWIPRAFGRVTPRFKTHTTIEVIVTEV